jgi:hypothetical protein
VFPTDPVIGETVASVGTGATTVNVLDCEAGLLPLVVVTVTV